ncbi:phosphatase PAP2 family protein [Streptomyces sp. AK02-01A]|uniref:phosphatase PAP2 family protein n=1 Tax=Streptomyces sp. AK02-01A TaxID=3028648 RepID=UPI0029A56877|nr:phosphatase PAP2 family protein [Streptomyces sp. AK02-01A]MDX3854728.1 phosphatase PAP2 family protein [Streptomyces sp. AK02-01A]
MRPPSIPSPAPTPPPRPALVTPARTAALLASVSVVLVTLVVAGWDPLFLFDRTLAERLHDRAVAEPGTTWANRVLTDWVWDPWTMRLLTAAAVIAVWLRGNRLLALWVAATSAVGAAVSMALKSTVGRERPRWPDPVDSADFGAFPSGHAMTATVTCGLLLWLLRGHGTGPRVWRTALALAAVSVAGAGLTRLWLGVHWGSDVLAGWLLGGCVVALSLAAYGRLALSGAR